MTMRPVKADRFDAVRRLRLAADAAIRSPSGVAAYSIRTRDTGEETVIVGDAIAFRQLADEFERRWSS